MAVKKVIGLDFGTLSTRGMLLGVEDGAVYAQAVYVYPHGVIDGSDPLCAALPEGCALAHPDDYLAALDHCVRQLAAQAEPGEIVGIGVDATTYSMVPCQENGEPMCHLPEFAREPMAYIKLWKHHCAKDQALRIQEAHQRTGGIPAIRRCGGLVNCEWALPKMLETYELAPALAERTFRFCDLGEWLVWQLTGKPVNSLYSQGFKCMWAQDLGGPAEETLESLRPGFAAAVEEKLLGQPGGYEVPCGSLTPEAAGRLGLPAGTAVAAPIGDGSAPGLYFCLSHPGSLAVSYGTSIGMAFCLPELKEISGINGVVKDGIVPGLWGYDAGQPCAGDMLDWFVNNQLPPAYVEQAEGDVHGCLSRLAEAAEPWRNTLTVLDWWNGNRGILNDLSLRGAVLGLSLSTKPEDIYCAMLQGIACGSRRILDHLQDHGITFEQIIVCGGIAEKNPFALRQYADILGREILVSDRSQLAARSAAMLGAMAAGISPEETAARMAGSGLEPVRPDETHREAYEAIYRRWKRYHDCLAHVEK